MSINACLRWLGGPSNGKHSNEQEVEDVVECEEVTDGFAEGKGDDMPKGTASNEETGKNMRNGEDTLCKTGQVSEAAAATKGLSVLSFSGDIIFEGDVSASMKIVDLKLLLEESCNAPAFAQKLLNGDAVLGDEGCLGVLASSNGMIQLVLVVLTYRYAIQDGHLKDGASSYSANSSTEGDCQSGLFVLGGVKKYIKFPLEAGTTDFVAESQIAINRIDSTAVTFVFWDATQPPVSPNTPSSDCHGERTDHIGFDGGGHILFCEGTHWGAARRISMTPLQARRQHTVLVKRVADSLSLYVDGTLACELRMDWTVSAVGWRPWRNTIRVKSLAVI